MWTQAFDDCTTAASIFKLLEGFEGLLDRGAIAVDLERKALGLLRSLATDLRQVAITAASRCQLGTCQPLVMWCGMCRWQSCTRRSASTRPGRAMERPFPELSTGAAACASAFPVRPSGSEAFSLFSHVLACDTASQGVPDGRPYGAREGHAPSGGGERGGEGGDRSV